MNKTCIDKKWTFRRGFMDSLGAIKGSSGEVRLKVTSKELKEASVNISVK